MVGDFGRFRQIMINLIGNAIKFTEAGHVRVHLKCLEENGTDCLMAVAVEDTGCGIPEEAQPKIFQKFSQADASTTRRYGGTGLGLAVSKNLVELMGGDLTFNSKEGEGTTFFFTLRLAIYRSELAAEPAQAEQLAALAQAVAEKPATEDRPDRREVKSHILIAEDNSINQKVAQRLLERLGYAVEVAVNGHQAVQKWAEGGHDLILMDCQMPEMDGYQAAQTIRTTEAGKKRIPIIALTANAMAGDREKCLAAGMDGFISKPINVKDLTDTLERFLTRPVGKPSIIS
jgi:CheY-like chemotaxis protein